MCASTYPDFSEVVLSKWALFSLIGILFSSSSVFAFKEGAFYAGVGYYSQSALYKTTSSEDSQPSLFGTTIYPLNLKYDWNMFGDWFLSPQLSYALFPRESAENSAKVTMAHLVLPFGKEFADTGSTAWDWYAGPGFIRYAIAGSGGTVVLNNGTSTATFALPGGTSTIQEVTFNGGVSLNHGNSRVGFDLIFEGLMASKRTESVMVSWAYRFGGGYR